MSQRGGAQIVPRPPTWREGGPAPWHDPARLDSTRRSASHAVSSTEDARTSPLIVTVDDVRSALALAPDARPSERFADDGRASAVLALLYDALGPHDAIEAHVVLTRRARHLRQHSGEISFPGGRQDPGETLWDTAVREALEEIALDPAAPQPIGQLDHLRTVTSESFIVPFVATVEGRPDLRPHPGEVDAVLHVPLSELLSPEVFREEIWRFGEQERPMWFFELLGDTVWGATASMLRNLLALVTGTFDPADRPPPWRIGADGRPR